MVFCTRGAVQLIAYFFGMAPAVGAPSFFNVEAAAAGGLVELVSGQGAGGGVKRFDIFSKRMRLIFSSCSWFSTLCRRFVSVFSVDLTCFSMAALIVFDGVGFSVDRMVAVSSAVLASCCFMMTRFRFMDMAL